MVGPTCGPTIPARHMPTAASSTILYATSDANMKAKAQRGKIKAKGKSKVAKRKQPSAAVLIRMLQADCHKPFHILSKVGTQLSQSTDSNGRVSSLVLIRLVKLGMEKMNTAMFASESSGKTSLWEDGDEHSALDTLAKVCSTLAAAIESKSVDLESAVEGIKAAGVLSRILSTSGVKPDVTSLAMRPLVQSFAKVPVDESMEEHYLSGLKWAYDNLAYSFGAAYEEEEDLMPAHLNKAYRDLDLPFRVRPGLLDCVAGLTVANLSNQVQFKADIIQTTSTGKSVKERRLTAWEGESEDIPGFAYSSKIMETRPFSPLVRSVRDELRKMTGEGDYNCCLLNLYPDGESGMRYHIDPDQGELWGYETAVVSVGAARRFAFRPIPGLQSTSKGKAHNFIVMNGDVTEMFGQCQQKFQHTVKTAEGRGEAASRSSLVYKKTLNR